MYVLDPMLATGGSAVTRCNQLKRAGAKQLELVCLVSAPEGIRRSQAGPPRRPDLDRGGRPRARRERLHPARAWATPATACSAPPDRRPRRSSHLSSAVARCGASRSSSAPGIRSTSRVSRCSARRKRSLTACSRKRQQRLPVAADVEQADRLAVQPELLPREQLEQLVERPGAAGQRDHGVRQLGHQRLALVHRLDDVQLGQAGVRDLVLDQPRRDHADHGPAGGQRGIGQRAHQPHAARRRRRARGPRDGEQAAELGRALGVLGRPARARSAEDKNPFHRRERSSLAGVIRRLPHVDRVGIEERAAAARQALDQDHRQAAGHPPRRVDARPDHARGRGHRRQGPPPVREGRVPGADDARDPVGRGDLRVPVAGGGRAAKRSHGTGVQDRSVATGFPAGQVSLEAKLRTPRMRSRPAPTRSTW